MTCPNCAAPLSLLRSQSLKICTNGKCGAQYQWLLDDGQKPLIGSSRQDRKK